jgi:hypothetical protein
LSTGDVVPVEDHFKYTSPSPDDSSAAPGGISTQIMMKCHVEEFTKLVVEINDIMWSRRTSIDAKQTVRYSLGEIVKHKKYGFRGVIVAWDPGMHYLLVFFFTSICLVWNGPASNFHGV